MALTLDDILTDDQKKSREKYTKHGNGLEYFYGTDGNENKIYSKYTLPTDAGENPLYSKNVGTQKDLDLRTWATGFTPGFSVGTVLNSADKQHAKAYNPPQYLLDRKDKADISFVKADFWGSTMGQILEKMGITEEAARAGSEAVMNWWAKIEGNTPVDKIAQIASQGWNDIQTNVAAITEGTKEAAAQAAADIAAGIVTGNVPTVVAGVAGNVGAGIASATASHDEFIQHIIDGMTPEQKEGKTDEELKQIAEAAVSMARGGGGQF